MQLFAFAATYRVLTDLLARRPNGAGYARLAVLGLAMLPTAGYQYYAIMSDAVFNARVFATSTLSPSPVWVAAGLGLPLLLAVAAPFVAVPKLTPNALRLLLVWAVIAVAISYMVGLDGKPVSFQRKLLMGAHVPLCLLAGATLAGVTEKLSGSLPAIVAVSAVLFTVPSNVRFVVRDLTRLSTNTSGTQYRPYLSKDETAALRFLRETATHGDAVLVCPDMTAHRYGASALLPYLGVYVPAYSSATAYAAHWSETAAFERKNGEQFRFFRRDTPDDVRQAFLSANSSIRYVLYTDSVAAGLTGANGDVLINERTGAPFFVGVDWTSGDALPPFLAPVYRSGDVQVFRVVRP